MYRPKRLTAALLTLVVLTSILGACAAPEPAIVEKTVEIEKEIVVTATPAPKELISFGVQQSWKNDAQSAPIHLALKEGYYEEEGLDVLLVEGGPGVNGVLNTLAGREGIYVGIEAGEGNLIPQRTEGGMPLVIIGCLMQKKPEAYITLKKNVPEGAEITPALMEGKKIGVGGAENFKLYAMLGAVGLRQEDVKTIKLDVSSVQGLTTGIVNWANGWVINQTYDIEQEGFEWEALLFSDWGLPMHGNLIYTTEERIRKEPELLEAFLRATLRGVEKTMEDPELALQAVQEYGGGYDTPEKASFVITGLNSLATSSQTEEHGLGWVDKSRIKDVGSTLNQYTGIPEPDVDKFVDMQFIETINQ